MELTLDDVKLSEFNLVVTKGFEIPLLPSIKSKTVDIPGMIGAWDFGDELGVTQHKIPISSLDQNRSDMMLNLEKFKRHITDDYGRPRILKIVNSLEKDKFIKAKLRTSPIPSYKYSGADMVLEVMASDPRRYSRFKANEVVWGSEVIDFTYPYRLGMRGNNVKDIRVVNYKKIDVFVESFVVKPSITVVGSAESLIISNQQTQIKLEGFLKSTIKIDCKKYYVAKNNVEQPVDVNSFELFPGENKIEVSGKNLDALISIDYRDEY